MGEDLGGRSPGTGGLICFGIPDFPKRGGRTALLGEDGDPLFAIGIPGNRTAMGHNLFSFRRSEMGLGRERFPSGRILPCFESSWNAKGGERITKVSPCFSIGIPIDEGVAFRGERWVGGLKVVVPKNFERFEVFGVFVPEAETLLVDLEEVAHFDVGRNETGSIIFIGEANEPSDPGGAFAGKFRERAVFSSGRTEVGDGEFEGRFEGFEWAGCGGAAREVKDTKGIMVQIGIAPDPDFLTTMEG